jgi:hypothetical protein
LRPYIWGFPDWIRPLLEVLLPRACVVHCRKFSYIVRRSAAGKSFV